MTPTDLAAALETCNALPFDSRVAVQREAAQRLREMAAERAELRALLDAMSAARAPASADELDAARMDAAVARADLAAETATRTALRTQESQISGILADAGMPVGDLVRGVEALVRERDWQRIELAAAQRELHRLSCGEAIESDGLCPEGIRAEGHRAWSRLWHREARRLWKETQALGALLQESQAWEDTVVDAVRAYGVARRTDSWGYEVDEAHDRLAKLADELAR